jgi:PAS domain-containing protein
MAQHTVTFATTTSYGSWLPGDTRGYVQDGQVLPASPTLAQHTRALLKKSPVLFSEAEQRDLLSAFLAACDEFGYRPFDLSIESWHMHWIVRHDNAARSMIARLKNRMRQRLNRGRIWTEGYWQRALKTDDELLVARDYIRRHAGCRLIDGKRTSAS